MALYNQAGVSMMLHDITQGTNIVWDVRFLELVYQILYSDALNDAEREVLKHHYAIDAQKLTQEEVGKLQELWGYKKVSGTKVGMVRRQALSKVREGLIKKLRESQ